MTLVMLELFILKCVTESLSDCTMWLSIQCLSASQLEFKPVSCPLYIKYGYCQAVLFVRSLGNIYFLFIPLNRELLRSYSLLRYIYLTFYIRTFPAAIQKAAYILMSFHITHCEWFIH
jgi:hypothetical protein